MASNGENRGDGVTDDSACESSGAHGGWNKRRSQVVDVFSLGCVFHFVLVPGVHPFGASFDRERNILADKSDLMSLSSMPDALDLIRRMIHRVPLMRPTSTQLKKHPFFWTSARRLDFLMELSDCLEKFGPDTSVLQSLEQSGIEVFQGNWSSRLCQGLVEDIHRFRKYDTSSLRDLLRVIRNKRHHFNDLPEAVKTIVGVPPGPFIEYFEQCFPSLLLHCVRFVCLFLPDIVQLRSFCCDSLRELFEEDHTIVDESNVDQRNFELAPPSTADDSFASSPLSSPPPPVPVVTVDSWWLPSRDWINSGPIASRSRPSHLIRAATDLKYRSRLCTHWESSGGLTCVMRKKGKCDFAHGPIELRVKENRRDKWGRRSYSGVEDESLLLRLSGGEDVLGAARSIEKIRTNEGSLSEFERSSKQIHRSGRK